MDELWGIKTILDNNDDIVVFILDNRKYNILYCNHLFAIKTGKHSGEEFGNTWQEAIDAIGNVEDGRTYRFVSRNTPFSKANNVTVTQIVWTGGIKAYAFVLTTHIESKEEQANAIIFNSLGKAYRSMYDLDTATMEVRMLIRPNTWELNVFKPTPYDDIISVLIDKYIHPDDEVMSKRFFNSKNILKETREKGDYSFQVRTLFSDGEYHWTEYNFTRMLLDTDNGVQSEHIVCYQRDIHKELVVNQSKLENEMILKSLSNNYRSIYLLDMKTGEYRTVKPDVLLFGIPNDGLYSELLQIVTELIPDNGHKNDLLEYFNIEALSNAFDSGIENIGREYSSTLSKDLNWLSISAFKPPFVKGMERKCVITFMDITEHKRVEAQRNESAIALEILSSRYLAVFFANLSDGSFHSIRIPQQYAHLEKHASVEEAFNQYISCYVKDEYKEALRKVASLEYIKQNINDNQIEIVFQTIDDVVEKMFISKIPGIDGNDELLIAFEPYIEAK